MRKALLLWGAAAFGLSGLGCATSHEKRAEYHGYRAERAWDTGHPIKAAKEKIRQGDEERKADRDRDDLDRHLP